MSDLSSDQLRHMLQGRDECIDGLRVHIGEIRRTVEARDATIARQKALISQLCKTIAENLGEEIES